MPNTDLLPSLLQKFNENQPALEAAIMELSNQVEDMEAQQASLTTFAALWRRSNATKISSS
jgi:exonuclease VII small subunit